MDFFTLPLDAILSRMAKKSNSNIVKVGLVQMSCDPKPEANLKKAIARIGDAARQGAQIVCLQELFRSQYFCQTEYIELFKLAEIIPGPTTEALAKVAKRKKVYLLRLRLRLHISVSVFMNRQRVNIGTTTRVISILYLPVISKYQPVMHQ